MQIAHYEGLWLSFLESIIQVFCLFFSGNLRLVKMTRISAKELVDDFFDEKFNGKVRDRSQESRIRESPNKRAYNEDSLVFETKIVDREGVEVTVGALGMLSEEANKLSWKHFKNYMV